VAGATKGDARGCRYGVRGVLNGGHDASPVTETSGNGVAATPGRGNPTVFVNYRGADEPWAAILIDRTFLPVLVGELRPLRPEDLPADIAALARCQYLPLRHRDASHDLTRIVATIAYLEPELELRRKDGPRQELAG
jgi:hypothetical protein